MLLLALVATVASAEDRSVSHRVAQGRFFLESGRPAQALVELQAAAQRADAALDPELHTLLAEAALAEGEIAVAMEAIVRAHALTRGRLPAEAAALHEELTTRFGKVLVVGWGEPDARRPEPAFPLLDPTMRRAWSAAEQRLGEAPAAGSTSLWLPVGSYRVGAHLVEVAAGAVAHFDLRANVGAATDGVFGERALARLRSRGLIRLGADAFAQQGSGSARGRAGGGWLGAVGPWRFAALGEIGVARAERTVGQSARPALETGLRGGLALCWAAGRLALGPELSYGVGWAGPLGVREDYPGPRHYAVHGPDVGLRVELPGRAPLRAAISGVATLREHRPVAATREADRMPHLSFGGGVQMELGLGGAS